MAEGELAERNRRGLTGLVASSFFLCILIFSILVSFYPHTMGNFLKVGDPLKPADFIYLLGGDFNVRAPAAAALFHEGWAPLIVVAREGASTAHPLGGSFNFTEITEQMLYSAGVPRSAVVELTPQRPVSSTADEAQALRAYVEKRVTTKTIIVLTSDIHCRRARMMMRRILFGRHIDVRVWPAGPLQGDTEAMVRKEFFKFLFYSVTFW